MKQIDKLIRDLKRREIKKKPWETNPYIDIDPNLLLDSLTVGSQNFGCFEDGRLVIQAIAFNADRLYKGVEIDESEKEG